MSKENLIASMAEYASLLHSYTKTIDNGEDLTPQLIEDFGDAKSGLEITTDKRIGFLDYLDGMAKHLKSIKDQYATAQKTTENLRARIVDHTKFIMFNAPDIPFKGKRGTLAIQKSTAALKSDYELDKEVDSHLLQLNPYLNEYTQTKIVWDKPKIKSLLKSGHTIAGFWLEQGDQLRIRRK